MLGKFLYTKKKETEHHQKFACQSSENERPGREIQIVKCETGRVADFGLTVVGLLPDDPLEGDGGPGVHGSEAVGLGHRAHLRGDGRVHLEERREKTKMRRESLSRFGAWNFSSMWQAEGFLDKIVMTGSLRVKENQGNYFPDKKFRAR